MLVSVRKLHGGFFMPHNAPSATGQTDGGNMGVGGRQSRAVPVHVPRAKNGTQRSVPHRTVRC